MNIMLDEVERLLSRNQCRDWTEMNYSQLIYDFTDHKKPEFRLICTSPEKMDTNHVERLLSLQLPGFFVPSKLQLERRETLHLFLSQALAIPLQKRGDGSLFLRCVDEFKFVLTLDFTIKLLLMHERVECHVPCILEGETGVSKTAITKMYSILRNSSLVEKAKAWTNNVLEEIEQQLNVEGCVLPNGENSFQRLRNAITQSTNDTAVRIKDLLLEKNLGRPRFLVDIACAPAESSTETIVELLNDFNKCELEKTFFEINVNASLTVEDFVDAFETINFVAARLEGTEALVVVFLDEINTSSIIGLLKEVVIDHSVAGVMLAKNIVVVAACNPPRPQIQRKDSRERDLGRDWASGHYQVIPLPKSIDNLKWSLNSLRPEQEKDFIFRRLEFLESFPLRASMTELISESHEAMRRYAEENILNMLKRDLDQKCKNDSIVNEARFRARSVVSLRDIQRIFSLYKFFSGEMIADLSSKPLSSFESQRRSMLLSVACVYYFRLDFSSRKRFLILIDGLPTEKNQKETLFDVLNDAMTKVFKETNIPPGIAATIGLKENIFLTLICSLALIPIMIIGPPGSSKTLSVNIVQDNANGADSLSRFYAKRPRLSLFHYQCSRQSTSKEILAVVEKACERQGRVDCSKHLSIVVSDEAGLTEEEKESLKVYHFLWEVPMARKASVGFVTISNHILDAAKSNRCITLLRQEPDEDDMISVCMGIMFDVHESGIHLTHIVDLDGSRISANKFSRHLCCHYAHLMSDTFSKGVVCEHEKESSMNTFFGLRDFVYFLREIRQSSETTLTTMKTSIATIIYAIERNFNGVSAAELRLIASCFVDPLLPYLQESKPLGKESLFGLRNPVIVLKDVLSFQQKLNECQLTRHRFKLIIDCTDDDSILRLLKTGGVTEVTKRSLCRLSHLQHESDMEQLQLVSKVKFAALQGHLVVLSQTEPINESFYDLFNQRYVEVTSKDGKINSFTNIAAGGISRRCLVDPAFQCIIHIRESQLHETPAPFLNRFEKFRLDLGEVLSSSWAKFGSLAAVVAKGKKRASELASMLDPSNGLFGWLQNEQTIESVFVDMLPHCDRSLWNHMNHHHRFSTSSLNFREVFKDFLISCSSLKDADAHLEYCFEAVGEFLSDKEVLTVKALLESDPSESALVQSFQSLLSPSLGKETLNNLLMTMIQLIFTRAAMFRLVQVATPETIFMYRHNLPTDLLNEYFLQQHFSLKGLIKRLSDSSSESSQFTVVHTRIDQFINCIPNLHFDHSASSENSESISVVKQFIFDNPESVVIVHISRLHSASSIKHAIDSWSLDPNKTVLLLLIDMSAANSVEQANYIRMHAELQVTSSLRKCFVLLLHYSVSSLHKHRCYPSLFLSGWQHYFLDCIGSLSYSAGISNFITVASRATLTSEEKNKHVHDFCNEVKALFPRVLTHVCTQRVLYLQQEPATGCGYIDRKTKLCYILKVNIANSNIETILSEKFSMLWIECEMEGKVLQASERLLQGTTQLPLSLSLHSIILQTFQQYLTYMLVETNQWLNFDVILNSSSHSEKTVLFGRILQLLPVAPFEEMALSVQQCGAQQIALPAQFSNDAVALFPFFYLVSGHLDKVIEFALAASLAQDPEPDQLESIARNAISCEDCFRRASEILVESGQISEPFKNGLSSLVYDVVSFAEGASNQLFQDYLQQYLEWKMGIEKTPAVVYWMSNEMKKLKISNNIMAVHVIAKFQHSEIMKIASFQSLAQAMTLNFNLESQLQLRDSGPNCVGPVHDSSNSFDHLFCLMDRVIREDWPVASESNLDFLVLFNHISALVVTSVSEHESLILKLRCMSFAYIAKKADKSPKVCETYQAIPVDQSLTWLRQELTFRRLLETVGITDQDDGRLLILD